MKTASARLLSVSFLAVNALSQSFAQHEEDHQTSSSAAVRLDTVVVTASPIQRTLFEQAQPVNILDGKELRLRLQPTIGDTLGQQAGISSSYFGPVSSRPVIRGLADDRVQILSNGVTNLDVSNVSADHAVAVDPLTIDRIEVVRGPAALMYGPNSIGGVVNLIDSRIAEKPLEPNALGSPIRGAFDGRYNSVDSGGAGSGMVKFGLGPMVFHLDGFRRNSSNLRIPKETHTPAQKEKELSETGGHNSVSGRLPNSASQSDGGAAGASAVWDEGFFGLSYSGFNSTYGAVAERGVLIDLKQRRWDARGSFLAPANGIKSINYKFSSTDYQHLESGEDEFQLFKTRGTMGRVELVHEKIGLLEGAIGYQMQLSNMSVNSSDPAHALLPANKTKMHSVFIFEEIALEPLRYQFGARFDRTTVESSARSVHPITDNGDGTGSIDPNVDEGITAASREYNAFSLSGGVVYDFNKQYSLALNTGFTQRPPTAVELFARGPHHATGTFELGGTGLGMERALTFDLSFRKKAGRVTGSVSVFYNQFSRFIAMSPTGRQIIDEDGEQLPEYRYGATRARLYGAEAEVVVHLLEPRLAEEKGSSSVDDSARRIIQGLHLDLRTDYVRAVDQSSDRSLPRITPMRAQAALVHDWNGLQSRIETQYVARQNSLAENETRTASYTLLNASVSYQFKAGPSNLEFYVRGTNLTDRDARVHTSFLKDVAPLPARGVLVGLRADF